MFKEYYERLLAQLALEYNCTPDDLRGGENKVTVSSMNEGRRIYSPDKPFLDMVTTGNCTVITADECLCDYLKELVRDVRGHYLFEFGYMTKINEELEKYGYELQPTHHMFLPCKKTEVDERFKVKWLYGDEIASFYGDVRFQNAIAYPEPCPVRPDRMVVMAMDGDKIMGMSGCSEDCPHWQQIGIDVLPEYRSRGLGAYLVTLITNRIIEQGDVPFYGIASANIHSNNIALNSGFKPAWVETSAVKIMGE